MSLVRSPRSLSTLREAYMNGNDGELVKISSQLRTEQKRLIDDLATQSGESQATVLRAIIDEWREMKLRGW